MLIIIRGAPGSGKSTIAKSVPNAVICEADDWFVGDDEIYRYDATDIRRAHTYCLNKAEYSLSLGKVVVVANTFTRLWEMDKYIYLAEKLGIEYKVFRATGRYENVHGVPLDKVQAMIGNYEPFEGEIDIPN